MTRPLALRPLSPAMLVLVLFLPAPALTAQQPSPPQRSLWVSGGAGVGVGGLAGLLTANGGIGRWTLRGRYVKAAASETTDSRSYREEWSGMLGYQLPAADGVYDVALGLGWSRHWVEERRERTGGMFPWGSSLVTVLDVGPIPGLAFSIGTGGRVSRWAGLRLEVYGNVNDGHSFGGVAGSIGLGWPPM